jgi:hypothetical protein
MVKLLLWVAVAAIGVNSCKNYQSPLPKWIKPDLLTEGQESVSVIDGSRGVEDPILTMPEDQQKEIQASSIARIKRILEHPDVAVPKIDSDAEFKTLNVPVKCNFKAFTAAQQYLKSLKAAKEKLLVATETAQKAFASELVLGNDYHIGHPCNKRMIDDYILGLEAVQALNMKITNTNFLIVGIVGACASINAPIQEDANLQQQAVAQTQGAWDRSNGLQESSYQEFHQPMPAQDLNAVPSGLPSDPNSFGSEPAGFGGFGQEQGGFGQEQTVPSAAIFLDPAAGLALS